MASFRGLLDSAQDAWNDDTSYESPGARFGLAFDPTAYFLDIFGKGDDYRDLVTKSGDEMNRTLSSALGTDDRGGWVANKPVSTIGLMVGGYNAGAGMGLLGGDGGGVAGGTDLGIFANGGQGGLTGLGGGNAGALAQSGGISGGAGMGSATAAAPMGWQQYLEAGQGLMGQQQPQQQPSPPPPQQPTVSVADIQAEMKRKRLEELQRKRYRTPMENYELQKLVGMYA
jgi:hypothetical protein